ncbi:hypothetical protein NE865_00532 [Phthorimaea operculella]|nr:hypothetical protein NE865_00532 [Phthorimaea operculella]
MSNLDQLCNQVRVLTDFMNHFARQNSQISPPAASRQPENPAPSQDVLPEGINSQEPCPDQEFAFKSLQTTLKDSGVGKTAQERLDLIKSLQLFDSPDWSNINFIETQKIYLSKPGFVELEANDDLKPFDKNKFLPSCEKTLAAVTNAGLMQRELLQKNIALLLAFIKDTPELLFDDFVAKVSELFCEDKEYNKISNDIMQILCGKRASIISNRRTELLKSIQNSYTADKFKKIPPSLDCLFEPEQFSKLLEREGGPSKVFVKAQPPKKKESFPSTSKGNSKFQNQFLQPFRPSDQSGNSKSSRGKRKHEPKKSSGRRQGDSKRRRYD